VGVGVSECSIEKVGGVLNRALKTIRRFSNGL
jgi:hypothetical protein